MRKLKIHNKTIPDAELEFLKTASSRVIQSTGQELLLEEVRNGNAELIPRLIESCDDMILSVVRGYLKEGFHAIKNRVETLFTYEKFWNEEVSRRTVNPLLLKEFKNRWYILAIDSKDNKTKTFALDRLSGLEITKKHLHSIDSMARLSRSLITSIHLQLKRLFLFI